MHDTGYVESRTNGGLQESTYLKDFFKAVRAASQRVLMLDYDGTLAPFQLDPARASPYPGVPELLDAIMADPRTRLVIVSGRCTSDLLPLLSLARQPEIFGSHGFEQLKQNGEYVVHPMDGQALRLLAEVGGWSRDLVRLGARMEYKPGCTAIHWRGLTPEQAEQIRKLLQSRWQQLKTKRDGDLVWHEFDGGIELRVPGRDKGDVVRAVLAQTDPRAAAAYLGDDRTDEDAFRALAGRGLTVLVRPEYRTTAADLWIRPPQELLTFLANWLAATRPEA